MKPLFQSKSPALSSAHGFTTLFNVEIPVPALQRGWLHGRELTQPWHVERITARIGDGCWFSHTDLDPALLRPGRLVAHRDFELLTNHEARPASPHRAMGFHAALPQT